jgi:hypothetical protein
VVESRVILSTTTTGEGWVSLELDTLPPLPPKPPDSNSCLVKGVLSSGLIKPALLMSAMVFFWVKNTIQNNVYNPGISFHVSHDTMLSHCTSSYGILADTNLIHHLEDKVNFKGRSIVRLLLLLLLLLLLSSSY